jgi:enoyl-CoA hydratase/carnithine racemase
MVTAEPTVRVDVPRPGVGSIVLSRHAKRNAINHEMVDRVEAGFERFAGRGIGVVVLSAVGDVFSAGADLTEVGQARAPAAERLQTVLVAVEPFVVAVVDGTAFGAGISVLASCPVILASSRSAFVLPERALGVFPASVVGYLEQSLGTRRALELGVRGGELTADDAYRLGVVNEVHDAADLPEAVCRWTDLLVAEPGLTATASAVWRATFTSQEFVARKAVLDGLQVLPVSRPSGGGRS